MTKADSFCQREGNCDHLRVDIIYPCQKIYVAEQAWSETTYELNKRIEKMIKKMIEKSVFSPSVGQSLFGNAIAYFVD